MVNLAIISDIRIYREGLSHILDEIDFIKVVAAKENQNQLVELIEQQNIDIVMIDARVIEDSMILSQITENFPGLKIIVFAIPSNTAVFPVCVDSGVSGYLPINATIEDLIEAIEFVYRDRFYCSNNLVKNIFKRSREPISSVSQELKEASSSSLIASLTKRERQLVSLIVDGLSNKEIAKHLNIEISTVKNHVHNILFKLGAESRTQVARIVRENSHSYKSRSLDLDLSLHSI